MTNLEWLEKMKKVDGNRIIDNCSKEYRKTKALEIIAEELMGINNGLMTIIVNGIKQQITHP